MVDWFLNPALTRFRSEVNERYPKRDKASDGTIGDAAHQATNSDHNKDADGSVDAWDMDNNLIPGKPAESDRIIYDVLIPAFERHEASQYWIYQRQIASRSDGWKRRPYTGSSGHYEHLHFNTRTAFENSKKPWLSEVDMQIDLTDVNVAQIANGVAKKMGSTYPSLTTHPQVTVTLSDEDRDAIAAKVISALKTGAFKFEEETN